VRRVIAAAAKKKREDDTQAAGIAAPTSDTGVNARGRSNFVQAQHHLAEALEMDGLIRRSGSRPLSQKDLLKLYSCRRL
jgi:hypothetical protein